LSQHRRPCRHRADTSDSKGSDGSSKVEGLGPATLITGGTRNYIRVPKSFDAAQATLTGIELVRMIQKGQMEGDEMMGLSVAEQFYQLAAYSPH